MGALIASKCKRWEVFLWALINVHAWPMDPVKQAPGGESDDKRCTHALQLLWTSAKNVMCWEIVSVKMLSASRSLSGCDDKLADGFFGYFKSICRSRSGIQHLIRMLRRGCGVRSNP